MSSARILSLSLAAALGLLFSPVPDARAQSKIPDAQLAIFYGGLTTYSECKTATGSTCPGSYVDCSGSNGSNGGRDCIVCAQPDDNNCNTATPHTTPVKKDCKAKKTNCANAAGAIVHYCDPAGGGCTGSGGTTTTPNCSTVTQPDCTPPQ